MGISDKGKHFSFAQEPAFKDKAKLPDPFGGLGETEIGIVS